MIGKTSIGRSFKGCCAYNMKKVEAGQGEVLLAQGVRAYDEASMVADFVRQAGMNPDLSRSVWHTALSFAPQDEARLRAEPALMLRVARDYLAGMGLEQSQYVVVRHDDTDHTHLHLIANRVANDGQTVRDGHNYSRSAKLLRQIEQTHGLMPLAEQAQRPDLSQVPARDRERIALRDQVRASLSQSTSGQELQQALARHQIRMLINRDQAGQPRGVTFEQRLTDEAGAEQVVAFKGSKLHQTLSMAHLQRQLAENARLRQRQVETTVVKPTQVAPPPMSVGMATPPPSVAVPPKLATPPLPSEPKPEALSQPPKRGLGRRF